MKDPFVSVRKIAANDRQGAAQLARRAATALEKFDERRDVSRAARILLRAKPAMAPMWHLCALALDEPGSRQIRSYAELLKEQQASAASNARWIGTGRSLTVVTWSDSSALMSALEALAPRIREVRCGISEPGGEGSRLASRSRRRGLTASTFLDADAPRALDGADLVLIGADAIGGLIVNKVGSRMLLTLARSQGVSSYAVAASSKLLPSSISERAATGAFESFDAALLEAVITEDGPRGARWLASHEDQREFPPGLVRMIG